MGKPIAVLGADIHYNINTLELADAATRQMVAKANQLNVPLVIAGDLHDTKAHLRAECEEAMIVTLQGAKHDPIILVGNHCRRNERSPEHALHFLRGIGTIIDKPCSWSQGSLSATLIPYQHNQEEFKAALAFKPPGSLVICHQGIIGADMGHYVQDKSAITKEDVAAYRVVSGHYHRRQDIDCGTSGHLHKGIFSYIGNPYSLTFGEAKDPEKGFQILMDDGTLEFVPTNLRRHLVIAIRFEGLAFLQVLNPKPRPEDPLWLKVQGSSAQLASIKKKDIALVLGREDFKYDPIRTDVGTEATVTPKMSSTEAMDAVIEGSPDEAPRKDELKKLYRELME